MKSLKISQSVNLIFALLLVAMPVLAQDKPRAEKPAGDKPSEANVVEFGVRYRWGDVYGRPDLLLGPGGPAASGNPSIAPGCLGCGTAFDPLLSTSKYEEYRDLRNGFFVRKLDATFDNILGSRNYVRAAVAEDSVSRPELSGHIRAVWQVQVPVSLRRNSPCL